MTTQRYALKQCEESLQDTFVFTLDNYKSCVSQYIENLKSHTLDDSDLQVLIKCEKLFLHFLAAAPEANNLRVKAK